MSKEERLMIKRVNRMLFLHFAVQLFLEKLARETKLAANRIERYTT